MFERNKDLKYRNFGHLNFSVTDKITSDIKVKTP